MTHPPQVTEVRMSSPSAVTSSPPSWLLTPFCTDALRICENCAASYSRTSASMESK